MVTEVAVGESTCVRIHSVRIIMGQMTKMSQQKHQVGN